MNDQPRPKLEILHVITTTRVGGAENQLLQLIKNFPAGYRQMVVCLEPEGPLGEEMRKAGADRVFHLGLTAGPLALIKGLNRLAGLIHYVKPHLIQGWMYHANLLSTIAARLSGKRPVIWGIRCTDMRTEHYSTSTRLVMRACAKLAKSPKFIVANSRAGLEHHQAQDYPANRLRFIPNGIDAELYKPDPEARARLRAELGIAPNAPVAGMVARFDAMKDFATLLKSLELAARELPEAHFILAGEGVLPENPALAPAREEALAGRCHLLGRRDDIPALLPALDLHLLSSAFGEGFSNAIGEAMAAGLPNLATEVGDNRLLIEDCGRVVPPEDPGALAQGLIGMLSAPNQELAEMGQRARARIQDEFSPLAMARAYERLYLELFPWAED